MATESENKLAELELNIKTATIECERVESIVTALDASIAEAQQTHAEHYQKTDAEQCQSDIYGGLAELGKLDGGLKAEFAKVKAKLLSLGESKKALPSISELNERKRLILAALSVQKEKLHEMELLYPEAVRAVDLDRARKELTVFMELSAKLAASVVKLAVLNEVLDDAIFYHGSGFVLPKPYLKPFCDEADLLLYHQSSGQVNCITDTLRTQIIAAGGMQWAR
ncbi:MAG: hypothetical protein RI893_1063 [Pseudomonadota bacterium]|jgi:hypothetical protein